MAGTTSSSASNAMSEMDRSLKRGSGDIGWEYAELADASNLDSLKCKLCGKLVSGGIYRMKQHIAHIKGNVAPCKKSSDEDKAKCKNAIEEAKSKKKQKSRHEAEVRQEVILEGDEDNEASQGTRRMLHTLEPMDRFASPINPYSSLDESRKMRQQNINDALFKQRTHSVHQYLARWVHEAGIPFHAIDSDSFKKFVEAVGQFDLGYRPPSQYQLREPLLKEEVERTKSSLKKQEEEWALNGCSIMTDPLSASFWNGVSLCFKVFTPLVKVLRLVDGDRKPSMGFVYGELLRAKEEIKMAFKDQEAHYRPILDIVDEKARDRLDSPLHFAGYLLNPYYTYVNPSIENDNAVMDEFFTFVEVFFPDDIQTQSLVINVELHKYLKKEVDLEEFWLRRDAHKMMTIIIRFCGGIFMETLYQNCKVWLKGYFH
ncbi:uncharacterized protein LOC133735244 [Rosa rugosa]|uniref:uncharacterized protein LOC133735244 n=1 Tax=Rosa rugosa TaxID=74645 RepID=UPI002B40A07B|nr:uncharacterized protein LOC133735244 [Rosa rugosa]